MAADPLDALRQPVPPTPVAPRPEFAGALRGRIEAAIAGEQPADQSGDHPAALSPSTTDPVPQPIAGPPDRSTNMSDVLTTSVSLTPYLCCKDANAAIDFYVAAFGAVEVMRLQEPSGRIGHAELTIGGVPFDLADEYPEYDVVSPQTLGGTPFSLSLEVPNVDEVFARAVAAGATALRELSDEFYGYRVGQVRDPFGYKWSIRTKLEDLSNDELGRRFRELDQS